MFFTLNWKFFGPWKKVFKKCSQILFLIKAVSKAFSCFWFWQNSILMLFYPCKESLYQRFYSQLPLLLTRARLISILLYKQRLFVSMHHLQEFLWPFLFQEFTRMAGITYLLIFIKYNSRAFVHFTCTINPHVAFGTSRPSIFAYANGSLISL